MTPIQRGDLGNLQPFGDSDNTGVDRPDRKVCVLLNQFAGPGVVGGCQIDLLQLTGSERAEKQGF